MPITREVEAFTVSAWLLMAGLALLSSPIGAAELAYSEAARRVVLLTVAVDRGEGHQMVSGHASGFFIDAEGVVLTVRHLVPEGWRDRLHRSSEWRRFQFFGQIGGKGKRISFSLYAVPEDGRDVMLLKATDPTDREFPFLPLSPAVEISAEAELVVFGFPRQTLRRKPSSLSSPCTAAASCEINHKLPVGFSGGAVVRDGSAVGLVSRSGTVEESAFVPIAAIRHWISTLIEFPQASGPQPGADADAIPQLLSPPDGAHLNVFPRNVTLKWSRVRSARSYVVELEIQNPRDSSWSPHPFGLGRKIVAASSYTFVFVGSQPGRWRVAARDAKGNTKPFSHWSYFDFSPRAEDLLQGEIPVEETDPIAAGARSSWEDLRPAWAVPFPEASPYRPEFIGNDVPEQLRGSWQRIFDDEPPPPEEPKVENPERLAEALWACAVDFDIVGRTHAIGAMGSAAKRLELVACRILGFGEGDARGREAFLQTLYTRRKHYEAMYEEQPNGQFTPSALDKVALSVGHCLALVDRVAQLWVQELSIPSVRDPERRADLFLQLAERTLIPWPETARSYREALNQRQVNYLADSLLGTSVWGPSATMHGWELFPHCQDNWAE